jgi:amino acid transporter
MLWSAGKRLGAALGGSLPWQEADGDKAGTARFFGQCAAFAAMVGFSLWLAALTAKVADVAAMADFIDALAPLTTATWLAAGIFALVALACRPPSHERTVPR